MTHYIKTFPEYYEASASDLKPFTVRKDEMTIEEYARRIAED